MNRIFYQSSFWHKVILGILIVGYLFMTITSSLGDSTTSDERIHLVSGVSYLRQHTYALNPEHPPLIKILSASLVTFLNFRGVNPFEAKDIPIDLVLFLGRLPNILLGLVLGLLIFAWLKRSTNTWWALLGSGFYFLDPNIIAHSHYITTDIGVTLGIFLSVFGLYLYEQTSKKLPYIIMLLGISIALLSKFSGVIVLVLIPLLWVVSRYVLKKDATKFSWKNLILLLFYSLLALAACYALVMYRQPVSEIIETIGSYDRYPVVGRSIIVALSHIPFITPLVEYLYGLGIVLGHASVGHDLPQYLLGNFQYQGWSWYFPFAMLIKTQLGLIIYSLLALLLYTFSLIKSTTKKQMMSYSAIIICISLLTLSLAFLPSKLNIGIRHILPLYPFIILAVTHLASYAYTRLAHHGLKRYVPLLCAVAITISVVDVVRIYPHFLSYFNNLIYTPDNGHHAIIDSNIDWGQDLKRLSLWYKEHRVQPLYVDYFGGAYLSEYFSPQDNVQSWSVDKGFPKTGYLAVSVQYMYQSLFFAGMKKSPYSYQALLNQEPALKIGYSIYIYDIRALSL